MTNSSTKQETASHIPIVISVINIGAIRLGLVGADLLRRACVFALHRRHYCLFGLEVRSLCVLGGILDAPRRNLRGVASLGNIPLQLRRLEDRPAI